MSKLDIKVLTAIRLAKLFIAGSRWVSKYSDILNDLNVYPVPDGDTGTNMSMTLQAVEKDIIALDKEMTMNGLVETISESVLLGARGNSGTILSQIIQGFLNGIAGKAELDIKDAIHAFDMARENAYKAVANPVEGTILTVIRRIAEESKEWPEEKENFIDFLAFVKDIARRAVEDTKDMLPKLKEANVVDAGGKGLYYFFEGFEKSVTDIELAKDLERIVNNQAKRKTKIAHIEEELEHGYCTEFVILSDSLDESSYREKLESFGDSIIVAKTKDKVKTHIHTDKPGNVLDYAMGYGQLMNIKIDNMSIQHKNILLTGQYEVDSLVNPFSRIETANIMDGTAFIAVADTSEMAEVFLKRGATAVIIGGQSHNPSVGEFEEIISRVDCDKVVILPNNKNIIPTANIVVDRIMDKEAISLDTKSIMEGYYVLRNRNESLEEILRGLNRNISIEITKAVKDSKVNNLHVDKGDYLGIVNGKIKYVEQRVEKLISSIYRENINRDTLRIFAVHGKDTTKAGNDMLISPEIDITLYDGQQENYNYYIYLENRDDSLPEIAIVTDSSCDLTLTEIEDLGATMVPIVVDLNDKTYKAGFDLHPDEFWRRLANGEKPKTAQTSPAYLKETYEKLFAKGYRKIISLFISNKMSGQQQAAKLARSMTGREDDIEIVDTKAVSGALAHLVKGAAKLAKNGEELENILHWVETTKEKAKIFFVVSDLDYLEKGGRIGKTSATIGGVVKLKPILKVENGQVGVYKKVFGESRAINYLEKKIKEQAKNGSIVVYPLWGGTNRELEIIDGVSSVISKNSKIDCYQRVHVGPVIGTHSGPVFGVAIFPKIN